MPIRVVTGPPFSGKSQKVRRVLRPGDVVLDTTRIWGSFKFDETERSDSDGRIANAGKRAMLDAAVAEDRDGYLLVAQRDPERLKRWLKAAGQPKAFLITEAMDELKRRARAAGPLCEALVDKWEYWEDDSDFMQLTEGWNEDDMRSIIDVETEYRAACESLVRRDDPQGAVCRCLTEDADLRADMDSREIAGILVRYGDEARVPGFRERIAPGHSDSVKRRRTSRSSTTGLCPSGGPTEPTSMTRTRCGFASRWRTPTAVARYCGRSPRACGAARQWR